MGKKDESVASNLKRKCRELSILKPNGFLDPDALKKAFLEAILDIEDFKSAFKWNVNLLRKYVRAS